MMHRYQIYIVWHMEPSLIFQEDLLFIRCNFIWYVVSHVGLVFQLPESHGILCSLQCWFYLPFPSKSDLHWRTKTWLRRLGHQMMPLHSLFPPLTVFILAEFPLKKDKPTSASTNVGCGCEFILYHNFDVSVLSTYPKLFF